jgi:DNA-directed RNA polymerase specialized sigma24 family protein
LSLAWWPALGPGAWDVVCRAIARKRRLWGAGLAKDVVSEVFVKLWSEPGRFDPARGRLRSFPLAQTYNRAVDLLRSESARRAREEREARMVAPKGVCWYRGL